MYEEDTRHLHIEFFESEPEEDKAESKKHGRPIFKTKEMVRIRFVGDNKRIHVAPANEVAKRIRDDAGNYVGLSYKERWPKHYEAFKAKQAPIVDGTPLTEMASLTSAKIAELRALNIHTLEALASLDTTGQKRLGMGALTLKQQAQAHLDKMEGESVEMRLVEQNAALQAQIDDMKAQMADLSSRPADTVSASPFHEMETDDIRAWLTDRTGERPHGNISHDKLVKMADEVIAKETEKAA